MPELTDVLIAGCGSAGLCAALWLSRHGISFKILERRRGPLEIGQADSVQCRTVEIFESFGMAEELMREAYHVQEVAFWAVDNSGVGAGEKGEIRRTHFAADVPPGLSHLPHLILDQARVNALMIREIERMAGTLSIEYDTEVRDVRVDGDVSDLRAHAVCVRAMKGGVEKEFRAKYVLACDGAHSAVRQSLGFRMIGDSSDAVWGVMDIYARTNFPDVRKKSIIHSTAGNMLLVPREGDSLVRIYVEQTQGTTAAELSLEKLHESARLILEPYEFEILETLRWSVYSIGQRLADHFHKDYRVFLTGDSCHTHSPKAGQGMNVSLQDGYNIGWKLGAVLRGRALPQLLETYVSEREVAAADLIEFDLHLARLFSSNYCTEHGISARDFQEQFVRARQFAAGLATKYWPSLVVSPNVAGSPSTKGLVAGMRFPSTQVVRFGDARAIQLLQVLRSDCRWRVIVFAGDIREPAAAVRLEKVANDLAAIVAEFTPQGSDPDSAIESLLVVKSRRAQISQEQIPGFFRPALGKWEIRSLLKVFVDDDSYNSGNCHAYQFYGIDPRSGTVVVVRPDQYIAKISPLQDVYRLRPFFRQFLVPLSEPVEIGGNGDWTPGDSSEIKL